MSRELLKRALESMRRTRSIPTGESIDTMSAIETYLAQPEPEPEPVAWMVENHPANDTFVNFTPNFNSHFEKLCCKVTPLYTTPPDQSARIAELELALARANADIESVENRLIVKNQRLYEYNEKLAAMQVKCEPLSDEEVNRIAMKVNPWSGYRFARAIETAHGIGINHE